MITVPVELADRSYDVVIGSGARQELASVLDGVIDHAAARVAVVTQDIGIEVEPGREHEVFTIPRGEQHKSLATVEDLCGGFARAGLTRRDVVVAVGGGLVTDVGGFAASVYHRGIAVVHVSTTLLGQIDASVGGKTGVNLAEGKNLVGTFWQPAAVICDTELLARLPPEEYRSGLGELAKYHFIGDIELDGLEIDEKVAACVRIKADVVSADEREAGSRTGRLGREILNYGHTLAHAIETAGGYGLRHGEAVGIGLVYAAELAAELGRISPERVQEHREVVGGYDLSTTLPEGLAATELIELFGRDKKAIGEARFVLDGESGLELVDGISVDAMGAALARMGPS